jgi:hypothetical protein
MNIEQLLVKASLDFHCTLPDSTGAMPTKIIKDNQMWRAQPQSILLAAKD